MICGRLRTCFVLSLVEESSWQTFLLSFAEKDGQLLVASTTRVLCRLLWFHRDLVSMCAHREMHFKVQVIRVLPSLEVLSLEVSCLEVSEQILLEMVNNDKE